MNILQILILSLLVLFLFLVVVYLIREWRLEYLIKNEHICLIKKACKQGRFKELYKSCVYVVKDYQNIYRNNNIDYFFQREWFIDYYQHTFCVSYRILKYLDNSKLYEKYQALSNKYKKDGTN